jgi:hypothetical protein
MWHYDCSDMPHLGERIAHPPGYAFDLDRESDILPAYSALERERHPARRRRECAVEALE